MKVLTDTRGFYGSDERPVAFVTGAVETAGRVDAEMTGDVEQSTLVYVYRYQSLQVMSRVTGKGKGKGKGSAFV